jgi:hypothetical protein
MPEYDQGRGKRNAGSAPIKKEKAEKPPLKRYVPEDDADPIVKEAYELVQASSEGVIEVAGKQPGFTKGTVEGIIDAFKDK